MTCSKYGILGKGNLGHTNPNPCDDEVFEFIKDIIPLPKNVNGIAVDIQTDDNQCLTYQFDKKEDKSFYLMSVSYGPKREGT